MKNARGENEDIKTPEKYEREKVERQGEELPCKTEDDGNERPSSLGSLSADPVDLSNIL